ncbi:MAG: PstS family phosphate ABC transporter substrate-binding protein [Cyanobacteriota bacterium]|nr:PstS family phosphate ABC transporter substrate-binding protein [Cyanobacteriota bacterium]
MKRALLATASLLLLAPLQALAQAQNPAQVVRVGGSSTVFPITQQAVKAFQQGGRSQGVRIELNETGTSGGFRQFCAGKLAIANASRPINRKELALCAKNGVRFVELPIAFDALTVVVNRANTWARHISLKELAALWSRGAQGKVMRWNQVNASWPARPIRLCGPGADSGTYDYFNKAVTGDSANSRRDVTTSEDDQVIVNCVAGDPNALGYFGYAYYAANQSRLKALWVLGSKGLVAPSVASVQNETYVPLSRPLFLYVNDQMLRQQSGTRRFLTYTLQNGLKLVQQAGYIPLPASTYRLVESKLYRHVLGSAFGGELTPGMSLGLALQRSLEQTKHPQFR